MASLACEACGGALTPSVPWCPRCLEPVADRSATTGIDHPAPAVDPQPDAAAHPLREPVLPGSLSPDLAASQTTSPEPDLATAPAPAARLTGWPRKAVLAAAVVLTLAIGSTLLPDSKAADPLLADVYLTQLSPAVAAVAEAAPALRDRAQANREVVGAPPLTDVEPLLGTCVTTLDAVGVPDGLAKAHDRLAEACDAYAAALAAARAWQADGNPRELVRLRIRLGTADEQWRKGLAAVYRAAGKGAPGSPGSPSSPSGPADPADPAGSGNAT
jgi:hypothetical protein